MSNQREKKRQQLRNLVQYKDLDDSSLDEIIDAKKNATPDFDISDIFVEKEDKKLGTKLANKYLRDYQMETVSDNNSLKQLIQLEILNMKLQKQLTRVQAGEKTNISLERLINAIHNNISRISELKDRLGMTKAKRDASKAEENQGSRTIVCGHCGKMILLKIKTDKYDSQKHPFFKDKVLYNKHLMKLFSEGKITKDDVAEILETSPFYVDWLLEQYPVTKTPEDPSQIQFQFN